jgi:hypothetical protein
MTVRAGANCATLAIHDGRSLAGNESSSVLSIRCVMSGSRRGCPERFSPSHIRVGASMPARA